MKRILFLVFFYLSGVSVFSQLNIADTFKLVLSGQNPDTVKIDKLNRYIFQYAPNYPAKVLIYTDTAIQLSSKIQDSNRIALSLNRKGVVLYFLGDYNGSLENYFLALSIKEKTGHKKDIWREYNNIGLVLRNLEQNEEALKYFKHAMNLISKKDNKNSEAILWNNIGICLRGLKKYDEAKEALEKALDINTKLGANEAMAQDLNNLGNVYKNLNDYHKAIEYYQKALEINIKLENNYEKAQNLNNLADVFLILKNFTKAKFYLDQAEKIVNESRTGQIKLNNLEIFSNYFLSIENYRKAYYYKDLYSKLRDSIYNSNRVKQFDQLKTLANAENEIQKLGFLKKINIIQEEKINKQRIIQVGTGFVIILLLSLLYIMFRNLKIKKKLNVSLKEHANDLTTLNEDLKSANEELISHREELEVAMLRLQSAQNQLIHSEKMASLGLLAAGVAHEINNPLNFIQGGIDGLESYFKQNLKDHIFEVKTLIEGIKVGVNRASIIVTSLNHYSRQEEQKKTSCEIHTIIDNCLVMLHNQIKGRIEIQKYYCPDPLILFGNESMIHQVMLNLLTNSVQSINNDGKLSISTIAEKMKFNIIIEDTGCGISKENMPRIFDPFFTTKEPGKGTGLGLSITYNIIKEHNGNIEFHSEEGKGTRVIISFPRVEH